MARLNLKRKNKIKNKSLVGTIFYSLIAAVLVVFTIILTMIIFWAILNSFKSGFEFDAGNYFSWPTGEYDPDFSFFDNFISMLTEFKIHIGNQSYYSRLFGEIIQPETDVSFGLMLVYTLVYAGLGGFLQTIVPAVVAYMLCKYKFKFSKILYGVALIVYIIPIVGNYPAMITLMRDLGIYNTLYGSLIQKFNFFGMYFFVFYAYFENYSDTYLEAAEIDGANQLQTITRVVLPMAIKLISTVFLISFVNLWNDYQSPLLYMPSYPTLAYGIYRLSSGSSGALGVTVTTTMKFAGVISTAMPVVLLFIFLKDKLMANLSLGGIKE
ncbi:MAG: carbohydrate ABC transporter permease [Bacilli bacterium]|nr:carbohydrate ABC transporter permease [Bacilli bacterium]